MKVWFCEKESQYEPGGLFRDDGGVPHCIKHPLHNYGEDGKAAKASCAICRDLPEVEYCEKCTAIQLTAIPTADLVERTCPDCGGKGYKMVNKITSSGTWITGKRVKEDCPTCRNSAGISTGKVWIIPMEGK